MWKAKGIILESRTDMKFRFGIRRDAGIDGQPEQWGW